MEFSTTYQIEPLGNHHDRKNFDCGNQQLNRYLSQLAMQDVKRNVSSIWIAIRMNSREISGFYTLSMAAVPLCSLTETFQKKLPRYGNVPAVRLGRLAVSLKEQGKGLGKYLLMDSIKRCLNDEIAWALFLVDAKDDSTRKFYENFGFFSFKSQTNNLYMPRTIIESELSNN